MDLLLVLEHHFYQDDNGEYWCDRVVNREFVERYLKVFDNVTIFARVKNIQTVRKDLQKVSGKKTYFISIPDFKGLGEMSTKIPKIVNSFRKESIKYSTIIFRAPSPLSLLLFRFRNKKSNIGIEFVMGADKFFPDNNRINAVLNNIIIREAKNLCLKSNGVSYVTSNYLQKIYPSYSIINGEDSAHFDTHYSSVGLRDYNFVKKNWTINKIPSTFNIIHIGYMDNDRKGQEILIHALAKIINDGINIHATFVGDGKLKKKFEELVVKLGIKENITFYGATTNKKEIANLLENTHLLVLPSKSEGLPRVIIEAMASSTPCIASNVDGIPELLDEECIVQNFHPNDYAEKIKELLNNWERMIMYSNKNFNKSLFYREEILEKRRTEFYRKLKNI